MLIIITCLTYLHTLISGVAEFSPSSDYYKPAIAGFYFMKQIPLTQGKFALVDDEDFDFLNQWKWYANHYPSNKSFYAVRSSSRVNGKQTRINMHREILKLTDPKIFCDHKDRNTLNNQKYNLRPATHEQNIRNSSPRRGCKSKFAGVTKDGSRWVARLRGGGYSKFLGRYDNEIDAALAFNKAAIEIYGEFASLNNIKTG